MAVKANLNANRVGGPSRQGGFTLTELMIVVAIIGMLSSMAIPGFFKVRENTRLNTIYHNLRQIDSAKEQWALENMKATGTAVSDITVIKDFLRYGGVRDVIRESYVLNPVGTPPGAALPAGVGLGPYAPGAFIPAP